MDTDASSAGLSGVDPGPATIARQETGARARVPHVTGSAAEPVPAFHTILFPRAAEPVDLRARERPEFFRDLGLDRLVDSITAAWSEHDLAALFAAPLADLDAIAYRQEVMRDLEGEPVSDAVDSFSRRIRATLRDLEYARTIEHKEFREGWFLASVEEYGDAVTRLAGALARAPLASRGLRALRSFLEAYVASPAFEELSGTARRLRLGLDGVRYALVISGDRVTVRPYAGEADYTAAIEETFARFEREAARDYHREFSEPGVNHVEAQVLARVARIHPELFGALEAYCAAHADFLDATIRRFYEEVQFYRAYLAFVRTLRRSGLSVCYPTVSDSDKEVEARDAFDPALAWECIRSERTVVTNDFFLRGAERILVVSGPNQGGKTTFARMFGQLHYLATLGLPVPGAAARLFLFDSLFTHFEREEHVTDLRGKLEDDLLRIKRIVDEATPASIVVLNEIFSSTTLGDAILLSRRILERISALDALCVCVTFLEELASFGERTVSMVAMVDPDDPARRTLKVERRPADGLAYALAIAERHEVTYRQLEQRIRS